MKDFLIKLPDLDLQTISIEYVSSISIKCLFVSRTFFFRPKVESTELDNYVLMNRIDFEICIYILTNMSFFDFLPETDL